MHAADPAIDAIERYLIGASFKHGVAGIGEFEERVGVFHGHIRACGLCDAAGGQAAQQTVICRRLGAQDGRRSRGRREGQFLGLLIVAERKAGCDSSVPEGEQCALFDATETITR